MYLKNFPLVLECSGSLPSIISKAVHKIALKLNRNKSQYYFQHFVFLPLWHYNRAFSLKIQMLAKLFASMPRLSRQQKVSHKLSDGGKGKPRRHEQASWSKRPLKTKCKAGQNKSHSERTNQ